jgi:hypothetical protein
MDRTVHRSNRRPGPRSHRVVRGTAVATSATTARAAAASFHQSVPELPEPRSDAAPGAGLGAAAARDTDAAGVFGAALGAALGAVVCEGGGVPSG